MPWRLIREGHIHIVYGAERANGPNHTYPLVHAHFNGSSWQVGDLPVQGFNSRIALDTNGHPHVLFRGNPTNTYGYAVFDGSKRRFEDTRLPWSWGASGLALEADGSAHISYSINAECFHASNRSRSWETTRLTSNNSGPTAIGLDKDGNSHMVIGTGGL